MTRKQWGQLRRQYVTITHGRVRECGHKAKFSATQQPKNNCVDCWEAFLMTSVDLDFIHAVLTKKGAKELVRLRGTKFTRMFHGWLAAKLLPALNAEANAVTAEITEPVKIEGGAFGDSTAGSKVQATIGVE